LKRLLTSQIVAFMKAFPVCVVCKGKCHEAQPVG
jgi:hypothetical protein